MAVRCLVVGPVLEMPSRGQILDHCYTTASHRNVIMSLRSSAVIVISLTSLAHQSFIDPSFDKFFENFGSVAFRQTENKSSRTQPVKQSHQHLER